MPSPPPQGGGALSLKERINSSTSSVLTGKGNIRNALLSKEISVPENPTFKQLAEGVNAIIPGAKYTYNNVDLTAQSRLVDDYSYADVKIEANINIGTTDYRLIDANDKWKRFITLQNDKTYFINRSATQVIVRAIDFFTGVITNPVVTTDITADDEYVSKANETKMLITATSYYAVDSFYIFDSETGTITFLSSNTVNNGLKLSDRYNVAEDQFANVWYFQDRGSSDFLSGYRYNWSTKTFSNSGSMGNGEPNGSNMVSRPYNNKLYVPSYDGQRNYRGFILDISLNSMTVTGFDFRNYIWNVPYNMQQEFDGDYIQLPYLYYMRFGDAGQVVNSKKSVSWNIPNNTLGESIFSANPVLSIVDCIGYKVTPYFIYYAVRDSGTYYMVYKKTYKKYEIPSIDGALCKFNQPILMGGAVMPANVEFTCNGEKMYVDLSDFSGSGSFILDGYVKIESKDI